MRVTGPGSRQCGGKSTINSTCAATMASSLVNNTITSNTSTSSDVGSVTSFISGASTNASAEPSSKRRKTINSKNKNAGSAEMETDVRNAGDESGTTSTVVMTAKAEPRPKRKVAASSRSNTAASSDVAMDGNTANSHISPTVPVKRTDVAPPSGSTGSASATSSSTASNAAVAAGAIITNDTCASSPTPDLQEKPKDTATTSNSALLPQNTQKVHKLQVSEDYSDIRYCMVQNTSQADQVTLQRLIGLKTLFAKQLPKMPKDYIARLVFDRRHKSLAILSNEPTVQGTDEEIIGAICYRPYPDMKFAEIAFCAVSANQQVKGYGTKVMNLVKQQAVREQLEYFITYADNYAIGYFKKQGFSKTIAMPKTRYHGLIKDYDGGTIMECYIHPSIDYTRIPQMIAAQRQFILDRIRKVALSHKKTYSPVPSTFFQSIGKAGGTNVVDQAVARAMAIPGVAEAGWTEADVAAAVWAAQKESDRPKNVLKSDLLQILQKIKDQPFAWPFREPVDTKVVTNYLDVITDPIDLGTMEKRIRKSSTENGYYKTKQMLHDDLTLMVENCKTFNDPDSNYYDCAVSLERFLPTLFQELSP